MTKCCITLYISKWPFDFTISVTVYADHYITMESFFSLMTPKIVLDLLSSSKIVLWVG